MLSNYTFRRYKDKYYVLNTDTDPITYTLSKQENCEDYSDVLTGTVEFEEEKEILVSLDGEYSLLLERGEDNVTIPFKHYFRLQKSLILNMKQALCGETCGCVDCDEVSLEESLSYQALFNQLISYQYLIRPYTDDYCGANCALDKYLHDALDLNKCVLTSSINSQICNQLLSGRTAYSRQILFYITAIYYTAFYYFERILAADTEEEEYVDAKFRWSIVQVCIKKLGINTNDIKDLFTEATVTCNTAPTVGNITRSFTDEDHTDDVTEYQFVTEDFTTNFEDVDGDAPKNVKILNDPFHGQLYYDGSPIDGEGYIFDIANVDKLTYRFTIGDTSGPFDAIYFQISDDNISPKYSNMGKVTIEVTAYVNQPPVVGDNEITVANRQLRVFTMADFTTNTTPPYDDPEDDTVESLRIDSLPDAGTLLLVNTPCTLNQIISAAQINAGNFKFQAPDQNNSDSTDWDFSLRDTGSMTWVS